MIASLVLLKIIDSMTRFRIRAITVWTVALLIAAIVLRARYGIFMPLNDTRYNLYNSTSFFLCLTVITWSTFWFFKKVSPLQNTTQHELSYSLPQRRPSRENNALSVHRYDEEIDYTLPSYSELPSPPAYTKLPDVVVIEHTQDHDQTMNTFSHSNPTHERHSIDIVDMNQPNHQQ
ncbi:uncharacterized protein B0P05DRAFT_169166 [Gilbertella persicaria]|uniref:uncharacterized protein n=1 Tax=Gilbertella persicaria TaxID=101096 RepID=UPI0022204FDC|nr:uncharacterized protein B0P05DRAFT_169166 [Gilbertella persicaria]KAI8094965.1 hypothetical protein B0P05DRAFT_169166 [Gilbertella persicaria]